jgi:Xaa-Pro aminopeptidase
MFEAAIYRARRDALARRFDRGLLLFLGNAESGMNYADNAYPFRQDSSFLYYWGVDDPGLAAIVDVDEGRQTLFGDDFTIDDIVWRGPQPSIAERAAGAGIDDSAPLRELEARLARAVRAGRRVHFLPQYRHDNALWLERLLGYRADRIDEHASVSLVKAIVDQRARKGPEEIREIETAIDAARDMHLLAMRLARPGRYEREVVGAMEGLVQGRGLRMAFPVIFSVHGETLHNHHHGNRMAEGQMAVNDSGVESAGHYASDITRTIPIGGRFVGAQRDLYEAVLRAQRAAIAAIAPGVKWVDVHTAACRSLAADLKTVGCMKGDTDAAVAAGAHAMFFQCGLGHMMGLDVHDMEALGEQHVGYDETVSRSPQFGLKSLRMGRAVEPGFVMTVEPGIYMIPTLMDKWRAEGRFADFLDYDALDRFRAFGGIRIEDDIVVTETGCRVLGQPIPKEMDEVEALASGDDGGRGGQCGMQNAG